MEYKQYEPSRRLLVFHIRGFQFWDGISVLDELKTGTVLSMFPEKDNPHDTSAIVLYYGDTKLGYVPAEENEIFFLISFYGYQDAFEARVLQIDREAEPWKQVRVGIYLKDARD